MIGRYGKLPHLGKLQKVSNGPAPNIPFSNGLLILQSMVLDSLLQIQNSIHVMHNHELNKINRKSIIHTSEYKPYHQVRKQV